MNKFLQKLWQSPAKVPLVSLSTAATGIVLNHLIGQSGKVELTPTIATDMLLALGALLFSVGGVAYSYYKDLEQLKKVHEEEVQVRNGIVFKRGKRTGGQWMPFCPVCEMPADPTVYPKCPDPKCGWQPTVMVKRQVDEIIARLPP
jgi:hypothetical protein